MYEINITRGGLRHFNRLPKKVHQAVLEAIYGPIAENPQRAGKRLGGEFLGLYVARRGDYRVIYEIFETRNAVLVHRVEHRRSAYRPR